MCKASRLFWHPPFTDLHALRIRCRIFVRSSSPALQLWPNLNWISCRYVVPSRIFGMYFIQSILLILQYLCLLKHIFSYTIWTRSLFLVLSQLLCKYLISMQFVAIPALFFFPQSFLPEAWPTSFSCIPAGSRSGSTSSSSPNEFRDRYPLTSQLIQENKIPEFGEYLFDRNSVWDDHFVQTTCTSISTALVTTVSLIL